MNKTTKNLNVKIVNCNLNNIKLKLKSIKDKQFKACKIVK